MKKPTLLGYWRALRDPVFAPSGLRIALCVGSLLFAINHGQALISGNMTRERWFSALLTYCVPYGVNIHGQYSSRCRQQPLTVTRTCEITPY
ncbi:MAG: nitrate/nitrite transporter NrtS [Cyanobacteria bacterium P01_H01_bin.15]